MQATLPYTEGYVRYDGYKIWYRVVGDLAQPIAGRLPIVAVHGSPVSHGSLQPLEALAEQGRPVIFYDQLGCGNSDRPEDPAFWAKSMQRYVDEVRTLRRELGLSRIHLLGHSWGGMVALEYGLTQPAGLASLVLASVPISTPGLHAEIQHLIAALPPLPPEAPAGDRSLFDLRHICRIDPWPDFIVQSAAPDKIVDTRAGKAKDQSWDITARLHEIQVPTLITSGAYDVVTPAIAKRTHDSIPGSAWVLFTESSHYPHAEEPERYLNVVNAFLTGVEQEGAPSAGQADPAA
jgi:pimeloyl-ACP methyl ester carboxylesterase